MSGKIGWRKSGHFRGERGGGDRREGPGDGAVQRKWESWRCVRDLERSPEELDLHREERHEEGAGGMKSSSETKIGDDGNDFHCWGVSYRIVERTRYQKEIGQGPAESKSDRWSNPRRGWGR